jgi:alpha-tubulin suppressor-like RCC1 family protein
MDCGTDLGVTCGTCSNGMGCNGQNQCIPCNSVGVALGGYHTCARKPDGTLWCWGNNNTGQPGDGTKVNKSSPVQAKLCP